MRDFDIDGPENGILIPARAHRGAGQSLHSSGWNDAWKEWIKQQKHLGKPITRQSIMEQAEKMMNMDEFRDFFKDAKRATVGWKFWKSRSCKRVLQESAETAGKMIGKKVAKTSGKAIPFVGTVVALLFWYDDVQAKGWGDGTANTILDAVPYFGTFKGVCELIWGDWFPDLDEYYDPVVPTPGAWPELQPITAVATWA